MKKALFVDFIAESEDSQTILKAAIGSCLAAILTQQEQPDILLLNSWALAGVSWEWLEAGKGCVGEALARFLEADLEIRGRRMRLTMEGRLGGGRDSLDRELRSRDAQLLNPEAPPNSPHYNLFIYRVE